MSQKKHKYDWTQFRLRIEIAVPVERVFRAWTDDRIVSKWFTQKTTIEPRVGGKVHFEWLGGDQMDATVTAIRKNRHLQFPFGKKGEQVRITLRKAPRGTLCELHQFGMKTGARDKVEMHMGCKEGWAFFLTNLKAMLEHGIDLRSGDPKKCYRQGYVNS